MKYKMRIVYFTAGTIEEAKKISKYLIKKKLVACANIFPIESMYPWEGNIKEDYEVVVLLKTKDENYSLIEKSIKQNHSYKNPAIYSWTVDKISSDYLNWVNKNIK